MIVGVGIDIVDNDRMALAIKRHPKIIDKMLTSLEIKELGIDSYDRLSKQMISSIAARFAAKEALSKSLGRIPFSLGLKNIEIIKSENGAPEIRLDIKEFSDLDFQCSISHSDISSVAVVIALKKI